MVSEIFFFEQFPILAILHRSPQRHICAVLEEEGEMTTKTEEDGTVSAFANLKVVNIIIVNINSLIAILLLIHLTKVEVGPDAHRVRAECRALDDQLGEKRSQWRVSR